MVKKITAEIKDLILTEEPDEVVESEIVSADIEPKEPDDISDEEREEIMDLALSMVTEVKETKDRKIANKFSTIGLRAQEGVSGNINLLRTRVGRLLKDINGKEAEVPKELIKLRKIMNKINPTNISNEPQGFFAALTKRKPTPSEVLPIIAKKYETVQQHIDGIIDGLNSGRNLLIKDNVELDTLYDKISVDQTELLKAAYFGELIMKHLQNEINVTKDEKENKRLQKVLHKVATRVQDLRTMEQVNEQFFGQIDLTIDNNDQLADSVHRTVTVCRSLFDVGLSVYVALANQERTYQVTKATQEHAAEMLRANAKAVRENSTKIAHMQNDPVLSLQSVQEAFNDVMAAMDETDKIKAEGIVKISEGINRLKEMSEAIRPKVKALHEARQSNAEVVSFGAEK